MLSSFSVTWLMVRPTNSSSVIITFEDNGSVGVGVGTDASVAAWVGAGVGGGSGGRKTRATTIPINRIDNPTTRPTRGNVRGKRGNRLGEAVSLAETDTGRMRVEVSSVMSCGSSSTAGTSASASPTRPRVIAIAARASWRADVGRRSGFLARHARIRLRTASGIVSGSGGGGFLMCAIAIATWDSPVKGRFPASAS